MSYLREIEEVGKVCMTENTGKIHVVTFTLGLFQYRVTSITRLLTTYIELFPTTSLASMLSNANTL